MKLDNIPNSYKELEKILVNLIEISVDENNLSEDKEIKLDLTHDQKYKVEKLLRDVCSGHYWITEEAKNIKAPFSSISFYTLSYPRIKFTF